MIRYKGEATKRSSNYTSTCDHNTKALLDGSWFDQITHEANKSGDRRLIPLRTSTRISILSCICLYLFALLLMTHLQGALGDDEEDGGLMPFYHPTNQVWNASLCPDGKFRGCEHTCKASPTDPSGYECACAPGYAAKGNGSAVDKAACVPVFARGQFLLGKWSTSTHMLYLDLGPESGDIKRPTWVNIFRGQNVRDISYDHVTNRLYWYSYTDGELHGASLHPIHQMGELTGTTVIRQLNDLTTIVPNIHVDPLSQNLYYLNQYLSVIAVIKIDGRYHKILLNRGDVLIQSMVVSSKLGVIAWTEYDYKILNMYTSNINGTNITRLLSSITYSEFTQLAIDDDSREVYWVSGRAHYTVKLDGSEKEKVLRDEWSLQYVRGMDLDNHRVYWSEIEGIAMAPKGQAFKPRHIATRDNIKMFGMLHVGYNASAVPDPGEAEKALSSYLIPKSECNGGTSNGGCQHLCLPAGTEGGRSCSCADGYSLDPVDGTSCLLKKPWKNFVAVADGQQQKIYVINTAHPEYYRPLPIDSSERPVALRFDPLSRNLIWSDIGHKNFQYTSASRFVNFEAKEEPKAEKDGSFDAMDKKPPKVLRKQQFSNSLTDGIALEPIRRLLYYSDTGENLIGVYDLEGRYNKYLIKADLDKPRSIALDRVRGLMFWTDWGAEPKIERATMAGTQRIMILNRQITWPNGLVIDGDRLYWVDAKLDYLASCNLDGRDIKILVEMKSKHPFGLSLTVDHFYWSDWSTNTVRRVSRHTTQITPSEIEDVTAPTFSRLLDITTFESEPWDAELKAILASSQTYADPSQDPLADGCYLKGPLPQGVKHRVFGNGNCSQFCFPLPDKARVCDCRDGDTLDQDGVTCLLDSRPSKPNFARRNPEIYLTKDEGKPEFEWEYLDHTAYADSLLCSERDMESQVNAFKLGCQTDFPESPTPTPGPLTQAMGSRRMECTYQCLPGFNKTSGDEVRSCYVAADSKEVKWTGSNLICDAITCQALEKPKGAEIISCNNTYGSQCKFACANDSQYISGDQSRTCQLDGKWSGSPLVCQQHVCQAPKVDPDAHVKTISCPTDLGDECHFECLPNYERVSGSAVIKCGPTGLWSAPALKCQESNNQCPLPDYGDHNIIATKCTTPIKYGDSCQFECAPSNGTIIHKPVEGTDGTVECKSDGKWSGNVLRCSVLKMCDIPKLPIYTLNASCDANTPQSECKFKCVEGMNIITGTEVITCQNNGQWNKDPIVCSDCPKLKPLPNLDYLNVSCSVSNVDGNSSDTTNSSRYATSKCNMTCKSEGGINLIDKRPSQVSVSCDPKTKGTNSPWEITFPPSLVGTSDYLKAVPYCGEVRTPVKLGTKVWLKVERGKSGTSGTDNPTYDITCTTLLPEIVKWLTQRGLSLNTTSYGRACLVHMDTYNNDGSTGQGKGGAGDKECPLKSIQLTCDESTKDKKLFTQADTSGSSETIPINIDISSNPLFQGGNGESINFWRDSVVNALRNNINQSRIMTHSFTLQDAEGKADEFFISEPNTTVRKMEGFGLECGPGMAPLLSEGYCASCPQGTKLDQKDLRCVLCPVGSYQDKAGQTGCNRCPFKLTTTNEGSFSAAHCIRMSPKRKFGAVATMFIIFMVLCVVALLGVGFYLFKNKQYPFHSPKTLLPIPTIFRTRNPEPQEMTSVPYGSFDNPLTVA